MRERLTAALVKGLAPGERLVEVCDTEVPGLSVVVSPGGSKTFFFRYRERESRSMRRYKIGRADVLTVYQARARAQELRAEVAAGSDPQQERAATRAGCLEDYLDGPYTEKVAHLKSHDAIIATLRRDFAEFLNQPLSAITTWKLEKWRRARLEKKKSTASCNRPLAYLAAMMNHAQKAGLVKVNPCTGIKPLREDKSRVRFLSPEERGRLLAVLEAREAQARAARISHNKWLAERGIAPRPTLDGRYSDHVFPLVLLAVNTGLRRGELFGLTWGDVDFPRRMLRVRADSAKSGKTRYIPLNSPAMDALDTWRAQHDAVAPSALIFPGRGGGRLNNINKAWKAVRDAAKLDGFHFHDLRHTFASELIMRGVSLSVIRDLLGHSNFTMTQRYAHLSPEVAAAAVAKLDDIGHELAVEEAQESAG